MKHAVAISGRDEDRDRTEAVIAELTDRVRRQPPHFDAALSWLKNVEADESLHGERGYARVILEALGQR